MNKKASILDIVFIMTALFTFAFVTVIMYNVYDDYTEKLSGHDAFNNSVNLHVESQMDTTFTVLDYVYIFFLVGFIILTIVSSFSIRTHPVFFFISVLLLVITIIMGALFSNVYTQAVTDTELMSDTNFTIMPFIMTHFPTVILIIGAILSVVLYAKTKWEEG